MIEIKSSANPTLKKLRSVKSKKFRDEIGLYLIEGKKTILEAFNCNEPVCYLILTKYDEELFVKANNSQTEIIVTPYELIRTLSDTKNPPDYLAYLHIEPVRVNMGSGIIIAADGISDPYNLGTIIRTADALGARGVLTAEGGCSVYSPKVQRAAMGSMFHIPVEETKLEERLSAFKEEGGTVISASLDGNEMLPEVKDKICLAVGNESAGISEKIKALSDYIYKIPMKGRAESLNVGVACGITLFELINGGGVKRIKELR